MKNLKDVIMLNQGMSEREALDAIMEARELVFEGLDPDEVLMDEFGVEPDYVFDLLEP